MKDSERAGPGQKRGCGGRSEEAFLGLDFFGTFLIKQKSTKENIVRTPMKFQ
jgi:hypothetical protein